MIGSVSGLAKEILVGVGVTLLYAALVHVGFKLPPEGHTSPVLYFAGGIGILILLMGSKRLWPTIAIGWLIAFQFRDISLPFLNQIALAGTLSLTSLVCVFFLEKMKFNRAIVEVRDVALLLVGSAVSALCFSLVGVFARDQHLDIIVPWTLANLAGTVLIVPVTLAWFYGGRFGGRKRWLHFGACVVALLALCAVGLMFAQETNFKSFYFLPVLIWAALAFNVRGMAAINLLVGVITYFATMAFVGPEYPMAVDYAQQSIVVTAYAMLILSAMADHRKENDRLSDREQRLASIFNTADDGILVVNAKSGLIDTMNPAAERMFGFNHGEGLGIVATDVVFPVGRESLHDAIDNGAPVMARRQDGTEFAAQVTRAAWKTPNGDTFNTKIVRDLTQSHRAAAELVDREERYRAIVETAVDGIIVIDSNSIIQSFNAAADRMFGYDIGEAIGQPVTMLMHETQKAQHDAAAVTHQTTGKSKILGTPGVVVDARRKDGSSFPAHLAIAEWFVGGERFYTGIMRDLTQQMASEEARDILAREVDHRAKNALAVVQSLVRLTKATTVQNFIDAVSGRIEALARAHSLLSQGNWGGVPLKQIAEDELAVAAKGSDVTITGTPVRINPDAVQPISMLFHELSTNAFKYGSLRSPEGSVKIGWKIVGPKLVIQWIEYGVERINPPGSSGFGSRMMKQVVAKQLEGTLDHDWREMGLVCTITLPARCFSKSTAAATRREPTAINEPKHGNGRRVLIVEDNVLISMELETTLGAGGYNVVGRANSVVEALAIIDTTDIDVAVLDVDLGSEQSFPIADALGAKGVPYAFATGFETLTKERGYKAPVLTKPVNEANLRRTFDTLTGDADDQ